MWLKLDQQADVYLDQDTFLRYIQLANGLWYSLEGGRIYNDYLVEKIEEQLKSETE